MSVKHGLMMMMMMMMMMWQSLIRTADLLAMGQGLYAFNLFLASYLMTFKLFRPRYILAVYLGLCFIFGLAATLTSGKCSFDHPRPLL